MNNYELLGKLITIHEECEDIFVEIGHGVDELKKSLIKDPEECDNYLIDDAILSKMITNLTLLQKLLADYGDIVSVKFMELRSNEHEE